MAWILGYKWGTAASLPMKIPFLSCVYMCINDIHIPRYRMNMRQLSMPMNPYPIQLDHWYPAMSALRCPENSQLRIPRPPQSLRKRKRQQPPGNSLSWSNMIHSGNQTRQWKILYKWRFFRKITHFCGPFSSMPCLMKLEGFYIDHHPQPTTPK